MAGSRALDPRADRGIAEPDVDLLIVPRRARRPLDGEQHAFVMLSAGIVGVQPPERRRPLDGGEPPRPGRHPDARRIERVALGDDLDVADCEPLPAKFAPPRGPAPATTTLGPSTRPPSAQTYP